MAHLPWRVVEDPYQPHENIYWETVSTLGNGYMGSRGCTEEGFPLPMETYPGTYVAGVFDNFEGHLVELVNVPDFFSAEIRIGGKLLTPSTGEISGYTRTLDMRDGTLDRSFTWTDPAGRATAFRFQRFLSLDRRHVACQRIRVRPLNHAAPIAIRTGLDGMVFNRKQRDWPPLKTVIPNHHLDPVDAGSDGTGGIRLHVRTKSTRVDLVEAARLVPRGRTTITRHREAMRVAHTLTFHPKRGEEIGLDKFTAVFTSRDTRVSRLRALARREAEAAARTGYDRLCSDHAARWHARWEHADIRIDGDAASQQGVRFNLFQLLSANARDDAGVNLAAKLLSHTRYKGNCFWDTEIFMFPFFVYTDPHAARTLLRYRYKMLPAARRRARDHWLPGAMYPWMSAHDGSEQCDSWEYGECEIHITADVAYAFDQYLRATGDEAFFVKNAAEVFIETARFWAGRVAWSSRRKKYTLLSVKGPDEYCSITNNNMFTNYLAARNLELGEEAVARMRSRHPREWKRLQARLKVEPAEVARWRDVRRKMYYNWDRKQDLLIQDDTFLDKEPDDLRKYAARTRPLVEIMPYERIMRVRLLRQTDVVLLTYLLGDRFTPRQKRVAYEYYEPMTTHDSSLSYNTHSIMAAELGKLDAAYAYFRKCSRLDLDDELGTARSGLHGASLGGTWQTVVNGFAGMRVNAQGELSFAPRLPAGWEGLTFRIVFRGRTIGVAMRPQRCDLTLVAGNPVDITVDGRRRHLIR